jgi:hypothetical protein
MRPGRLPSPRLEAAVYWILAFYVTASVSGHVRYLLTRDTSYFDFFPWWFSPIIMAVYVLFIAFLLDPLEELRVSDGLRLTAFCHALPEPHRAEHDGERTNMRPEALGSTGDPGGRGPADVSPNALDRTKSDHKLLPAAH